MSVRKTVAAPLVLGSAAAVVLLASSLPGRAAAQKFQFPTGRITYKLTSSMMNGTTTLHWSDFGKKFRQEMSAKMNAQGRTMDLSNWVIYDGAHIYMHNPMMGKQVVRMKVTPDMNKVSGPNMPMLAAPKNLGKAVGKATIAGKPCAVHQLPAPAKGKIFVWRNLPLKMQLTGGQMSMTMEATKVETGVPVPARLFRIPGGMQIKDFQPPKGAPAGRKP